MAVGPIDVSLGPFGNSGPSSAELTGDTVFRTGSFGPTQGLDWKILTVVGFFSLAGLFLWLNSSKSKKSKS